MTGTRRAYVEPGATIGVLGGGQLGRMFAHAAARLGYKTHVYTDREGTPASQVTPLVTCAPYEDESALEAFAKQVDVVTLEFENIPVSTLDFLSQHVPVHPGTNVLQTCQDRQLEKAFIRKVGAQTAPYVDVANVQDVVNGIKTLGGGVAILKHARGGYDGHGQMRVGERTPVEAIEAFLQGRRAVLEGFVVFEKEVSVIVARSSRREVRAFPVVENEHREHILWRTHVPGDVSEALAHEARAIACALAESFEMVGVLAVEFFVADGGTRLLVNEMAPRPHNSGHWTMDACATSQFEQQVRAVCGLPLGDVSVLTPVRMTNLLGSDVERLEELLANPKTRVHMYGKEQVRAGRKMGHYNEFLFEGDD